MLDMPDCMLNVPAKQEVHVDDNCPVDKLQVPATHGVQAAAEDMPIWVLKDPARQDVHVDEDWPTLLLQVPAAQLTQTLLAD